jgi:hypothetical protein
MGAFPMIIVPAFAVPLSALMHVLALRRLLQRADSGRAADRSDRNADVSILRRVARRLS